MNEPLLVQPVLGLWPIFAPFSSNFVPFQWAHSANFITAYIKRHQVKIFWDPEHSSYRILHLTAYCNPINIIRWSDQVHPDSVINLRIYFTINVPLSLQSRCGMVRIISFHPWFAILEHISSSKTCLDCVDLDKFDPSIYFIIWCGRQGVFCGTSSLKLDMPDPVHIVPKKLLTTHYYFIPPII